MHMAHCACPDSATGRRASRVTSALRVRASTWTTRRASAQVSRRAVTRGRWDGCAAARPGLPMGRARRGAADATEPGCRPAPHARSEPGRAHGQPDGVLPGEAPAVARGVRRFPRPLSRPGRAGRRRPRPVELARHHGCRPACLPDRSSRRARPHGLSARQPCTATRCRRGGGGVGAGPCAGRRPPWLGRCARPSGRRAESTTGRSDRPRRWPTSTARSYVGSA
jgi:hypothetical protein